MPIAPPRRFTAARRLGLAAAFQLCAAFTSTGPAAAWGNVAHRAIVTVAEQHLAPEAAKEVARLLALDGATRMSEVIMWADMIRRQSIPGTPEHDVPIPYDSQGYNAARDCQAFCAVKAIPFYLEILADRMKPDAERAEALKYAIHLVGDIHQPLHTSKDGGSQQIAWNEKIVYLHILWDVTILAATYPNPDLLAEAIAPRVHPSSHCGTAEEWANEGHAITKSFIYTDLGPEPYPTPIALPPHYAPKALPIIEERVVLAAIRTACVLNKALDPGK